MSSNELKRAASPYLLQHADNPVHWRIWGPEALAEAQAADKPILLSVGYAACHWCHVMAHESFEDPETARWMNELFVNIKVDREERPDVDQLYMAALHQFGEQGGWPLTMFLTPDGAPFWGGTYFPKTARWGRPGFVDVLQEIARIYREEPEKVVQNRTAITERLETHPDSPASGLSPDIVPAVAARLLELFDPVNGGYRGAPKFPQTPMLDLVWRAGLMTGETRYFDAVEHTLTRIARGGIYDHLGGGFARYSVDERWLVPHFEKMLYDNAQLVDLMTTAWLRSGTELFRTRIEETVDWLFREMATDGAFAASLDADSEGEEGLFYVWEKSEVDTILGDTARLFASAYDITPSGNFEGKTVLNRLRDPFPLPETDEERLPAARAALLATRERRIHPGRDDKILADWNALAIAALARAAQIFDRPAWLQRAVTAYRFVADSISRDGRLGHAFRDRRLVWPGFSSDYATMALAALRLFDVTADRAYLDDAVSFVDQLDTWHPGDDGTYRLAASDAPDVVLRLRSGNDEATANPNGVAATVLVRLYHLTGETRFLARADRILTAFAADAAQNPVGHASLLSALAVRAQGLQIVIVGEHGDPGLDNLIAAANRIPDPNRSLIVLTPGQSQPPGHPAFAKGTVDGRPAAYVCRGETCSLPVTDPAGLRALTAAAASALPD